MAKSIGISPSAFSRKIVRQSFTQAEKITLTELYVDDPHLPDCARDDTHTILMLKQTMVERDETIRQRDETIRVYDRGFRNELLVAVMSIILCVTILAIDYAPRWEAIRLGRIYGYSLQAERIKYLEKRVGDLEDLVGWYQSIMTVKDDRMTELIEKITEVR